MQKIETIKAPKAIGPYSQAIIVNGFLYSSGQIAINPKTNEFEGGKIEDETTLICENLKEILKEANLEIKNVVKTTIFLQNLSDFEVVNNIYGKYFSHKPARSTIEVAKLPKNAMIEIEVIAKI